MIKIRKVLEDEINQLQNFPPEDWNLDLPQFVSFHFGFNYFYPVAAEAGNKLAGFGNAIFDNGVCWIGNIIVLPEYRRNGIGYQLTSHLVEYLKARGCKTQLLIATEMGKNIYEKIGFRTSSYYNVYKTDDTLFKFETSSGVRPAESKDYRRIFELDREITGETRPDFIQRFFSTAFVYEYDKLIEGFFLPDLGAGFIAAKYNEPGLELLKFRLARNTLNTVVPAENKTVNMFLKSSGSQLLRVIPRMVLGENVSWRSELIFSRGAGYCG